MPALGVQSKTLKKLSKKNFFFDQIFFLLVIVNIRLERDSVILVHGVRLCF